MLDSSKQVALQPAALGNSGPIKSPTKASAARGGAGTMQTHPAGAFRRSHDDVAYRQTDSIRCNDQEKGAAHGEEPHASILAAAAAATDADGTPCSDKHSKYMQLLSCVYTPGPASKGKTAACSIVAARHQSTSSVAAGSRQQQPGSAAATTDAAVTPPLRSSASPKGLANGVASKPSVNTPLARRSIRASILDTSQGASLIPVSPGAGPSSSCISSSGHVSGDQHGLGSAGSSSRAAAAGMTSSTLSIKLRSSTGSSGGASRILHPKEPGSPVRRSVQPAQHKAHYAFGSRVDTPTTQPRKPSPNRILAAAASGSSPAAAAAGPASRSRPSSSPQRLPAAARASAPGVMTAAQMRSASAPRMSSADKAQSRFTQHAVTAAAAQRSKTPNPAARAAAAAAASGVPARRQGGSVSTAAGSRHVARMRASEAAAHSRLPSSGHTGMALRSPAGAAGIATASPIMRAAARSVPTAAGPANRAAGASRAIPTAPGAQAKLVSKGGRASHAAGSAVGASAAAREASVAESSSAYVLPVIKDRYKSLYKHTPAALAVEEARAAAAAAAGPSRTISTTVPRLSLGSVLHVYASDAPDAPLAAPRGHGSEQERHESSTAGATPAGAVQSPAAVAQPASGQPSPFLGRMSGIAGVPPAMAGTTGQQQRAAGSLTNSSSSKMPRQRECLQTPPKQQQQQQQQQQRLLSAVTPLQQALATPAAASPCTPMCAANDAELLGLSDIEFTPMTAAATEQGATPSLIVKQLPRTSSSGRTSSKATGAQTRLQDSPPLAPRNLSGNIDAAQGPSRRPPSRAKEDDCTEEQLPAERSRALTSGHASPASAPVAGTSKADLVAPVVQGSNKSSSKGTGVTPLAVAAKGLVLPPLKLSLSAAVEPGGHFESPPKHRRGETPKGPAEEFGPLLLKNKATTACSSSSSSSSNAVPSSVQPPPAATAVPSGPAPAGKSSSAAPRSSGPPSGGKPAAAAGTAGSKPRQRVGSGGSHSSEAAQSSTKQKERQQQVRRSLSSIPTAGAAAAAGHAALTPQATRSSLPKLPGLDTTPSHPAQALALGSPSKKLGTPVPRLDLTPVLSNLEAEQELAAAEEQQQQHQGPLLLEDAPRPEQHDEDDDLEWHQEHLDSRPTSNGAGKPQTSSKSKGPAGKARPDSASSKARPGSNKSHTHGSAKKASCTNSKGSMHSGSAQPQESYYVYESIMPAEETRTYEELRRVLMKAPGGARHAANLQGIWGCYQDARRNTEAMAFRGHRLLDQVSNEYCAYKRDAQDHMEHLQLERDAAREELQLAMVAGSVPATALQLAAKDKQVQELQEEVSLLRQQLCEMEKALHMASEYHSATKAAHQAEQVPVHARVIAGSATTNILTNLTLEQQVRLQQNEKRLEDMKAALHLACGVLRQTNYMDSHGGLRSKLDTDTLQVLDTIMATEEMEAGLAEAAAQQQQQFMQESGFDAALEEASCSAVHIEELSDTDLATNAANTTHS